TTLRIGMLRGTVSTRRGREGCCRIPTPPIHPIFTSLIILRKGKLLPEKVQEATDGVAQSAFSAKSATSVSPRTRGARQNTARAAGPRGSNLPNLLSGGRRRPSGQLRRETAASAREEGVKL